MRLTNVSAISDRLWWNCCRSEMIWITIKWTRLLNQTRSFSMWQTSTARPYWQYQLFTILLWTRKGEIFPWLQPLNIEIQHSTFPLLMAMQNINSCDVISINKKWMMHWTNNIVGWIHILNETAKPMIWV